MCLLEVGAGLVSRVVQRAQRRVCPGQWAGKRTRPHSQADIPHPEGGGERVWQPKLQAWGLGGPVLSEPIRPGHGRAGGKGTRTPKLGTGPGEQPQAVPGCSRRSIQRLGLPCAGWAPAPRARRGSLQGYLLCSAVRAAPAQPGQSLAQLVDVQATILVTVQLLEEATPALTPLRIARAPPHGARPGGRGGPVAAASAGA